MLLHSTAPFLLFYAKIVIISSKCANENSDWHQLARRLDPVKFILETGITAEVFDKMKRRVKKNALTDMWLVIIDDEIQHLKELKEHLTLSTCRHGDDKTSPCCHVTVLAQSYALSNGEGLPKNMRQRFQFIIILKSFAANEELLSQMRKEGVIPSSWTVEEIMRLGKRATNQEGEVLCGRAQKC